MGDPAIAASTTGPGAAAWIGALLYGAFGLVSGLLLGAFAGPLGLACVFGGLCVAASPWCVRDRRRTLAGTLLIIGGPLVGAAWGFTFGVFGAETNAQVAVATVVGAVFFGWPTVVVGFVLVGSSIARATRER